MRAKPATRSRESIGSSSLVRDGARAVKEQAAETVSDVTRKLREEGERLVSEQKLRAAQSLEGVGTSMREAAGRLQDGPLGEVSDYVEAAADRVSRASEYLADREVPELLRDAQQVVLRRPQWFLGGMFVAGLVLGRFLKATEAKPDSERSGARGSRDGVRRDGTKSERSQRRRRAAR